MEQLGLFFILMCLVGGLAVASELASATVKRSQRNDQYRRYQDCHNTDHARVAANSANIVAFSRKGRQVISRDVGELH